MSVVLLIARLLLAGVFVVAGVSKLADRAGSRQSIIDFGLHATLAPALGILVPLAELVVGISLLARPSAWWSATGALALLLVFCGGISYNLARGQQPDCHCFGQLHSQPIGWRTLVRNGVLAGLAGLLVWQGRSDPGPSVVAWLGSLSIAEHIVLVVAVLALAVSGVQTWVLVQVLQQNGRLLVRLDALEAQPSGGRAAAKSAAPTAASVAPTNTAPPPVGLPLGTPAPAFSLKALDALDDEKVTLDALRADGKPVVLVFSDVSCGPCAAFMPDIARYQRDYAATLTIALVSRGTAAANRAKASEHGLTHVLLEQDRAISTAYQVQGTPSAVLIRADGMIGSEVTQGADQIRSLVASAVGLPSLTPLPAMHASVHNPGPGNNHGHLNGRPAPPARRPALKVGDPAPELTLPDLSGKLVTLADYRGSKTLLLFWNPDCGFCQRMLDDLKDWEMHPPPGAPRLVLVSRGSAEANRAQGLASPILLETSFQTAERFGAQGTPSAIAIDEQGTIASEIAVGGPAVLALAGYAQARR